MLTVGLCVHQCRRLQFDSGLVCPSVQMIVTCLVEPGHFRQIHSFVQQSSEGQGRLEVVSLAAIDDTDSSAAFDSGTPQHVQPPTTTAAPPAAAATVDPAAAR